MVAVTSSLDRTGPSAKPEPPLAGIRVVDLTWYAMGPYCTLMLAQMGAEVIKIETSTKTDIHRRPHPFYGRFEVAPFDQVQAEKRSVQLNLKDPKAVELAKRLISISDIVVENFRPGVLPRLGLGYEVLRELRPDLIMVSLSANGQTGPDAKLPGYAAIFSAEGGLGYMTGYPDGPPSELRNPMDHVSGLAGSFAALAALHHRQVTGQGQYVDLAAREVATMFIGEEVLDYTLNSDPYRRQGNEDESMAPHNVYRCSGEDSWISIACGGDAEFRSLCRVMGRPDLGVDVRFARAEERWKHRHELDPIIEGWTKEGDRIALMHELQAAGVAAVPSFKAPDLLGDPHLAERGAFVDLQDDQRGHRKVVAAPWRFSETPARVERWSPELGEANEYVFCELLGLSPGEVAKLVEEHVIY